MFTETPLFMKSEQWYYWDEKQSKYVLTDKAPKEAVESYKKYLEGDCENYTIKII